MLTPYDPQIGIPHAIMDATDITKHPTGAITGIGAKHLAKPPAKIVGHLGARSTAFANVAALKEKFDIAELRVNSKRPETRAALVSEFESKIGIAAIAVDDAESAFRGTDIVTEATRLDKPEVLIRDGRGLEVSPCSLTKNQLLKGQVRNSPAKMLILFLKAFQFLHLVRSHAAILFAPAVVGLFRNANRPNRVDPGLPLPDKNINLS